MKFFSSQALAALLIAATLFLSPVGYVLSGSYSVSSAPAFLVVHAGGGGDNTGGDNSTDNSVADPGVDGLGFGETSSPATSDGFSFGFGIVDVVAAVVSAVVGGPIGLAAAVGISVAANAIGVSNPGVSVSVGTNGVSASVSSNVGVGGLTGAALGALGVSPSGVVSSVSDALGSLGSATTESSPSAPSQAAVDANTNSASVGPSTGDPSDGGGGGATCPAGYTLTSDATRCILDGYVSCAPVGYPDLMCPSGNACTPDGRCQAASGGRCASNRGQTCSSAANSCNATNQATRLCDGSCPATVPGDDECTPPSISLSEVPSLVNPGSACTVSWTVTDATACTLTSDMGDDVPNATLPTGSHDSPNLNSQVIYSMMCHNGTVVTSQVSITCHINPQYNNI